MLFCSTSVLSEAVINDLDMLRDNTQRGRQRSRIKKKVNEWKDQ